MDRFTEGAVVYHKATGSKCVVIKKNQDGTIKVRTDKDLERDYFPQELKTEAEIDAKNQRIIESMPKKDGGIG